MSRSIAAVAADEELVVAGEMLGWRIDPVREQREPEIALAVPEVVDLQAVDLGLDIGHGRQQHGNDHQRPHGRGHAGIEVQPRQRSRAQRVGHRPLDERDRKVRRGAEGEDHDDEETHAGRAADPAHQEGHGQDEGRDERDRREVAGGGGPHERASQPPAHGHANVQVAFEGRAAVGDQVVAGILEATGLRRLDVVRGPRRMPAAATALRATSTSARPELLASSSTACR